MLHGIAFLVVSEWCQGGPSDALRRFLCKPDLGSGHDAPIRAAKDQAARLLRNYLSLVLSVDPSPKGPQARVDDGGTPSARSDLSTAAHK